MEKLLEKYLLRSIARAPEDDKGGGQEGGGDANGDGGKSDDGGGDPGGDDAGGGDDGAKSALAGKGLFGKRGNGKDEGGEDKGDGKAPAPADGRPAHIPEKFWDAEKKSVKADDLAKAYGSLEKAHGELKRSKGIAADVPESEDGYFEGKPLALEDADNFGSEVAADDPGLKAWSKVAKKYGVGKDAAVSMAKEMFKEMNATAPAPIDVDAEFDALGDGAQELVDGTFLWLEGLERDKKIGEADVNVAIDLANTASGIRFLAKMRSLTGAAPIPLGLPTGERGMSGEEWHAAMREAVQKKDYKRQAELEEMGKLINGEEPATATPYRGIPMQKDVQRSARK